MDDIIIYAFALVSLVAGALIGVFIQRHVTSKRIGEANDLASRIVEYREAHGPFPSVEALDHVEGIGWGTLAPIRRFLIAG